MNKLVSYIIVFFTKGNERSVRLKKNIGASFIIKGISILLGLIKVPILISYLNAEKYGVWLTIASIIMWVQTFDLGLGHGLRNKFAEALAKGDKVRAAGLVSTAYLSMSVIMISLFIILLPIIYILDWNVILNVKIITNSELRNTIAIVLFMFVLRFVFQLISVILKADQRPALSDIFLPIASVISLAMILILKYFTQDSLLWASIAIALPPVVVLIIGNFYFFRKRYYNFKPSLKKYSKGLLKDIYALGIKFFVGQMLAIIMFQSANLILTIYINPEEVTVYNIANTYFNLPLTFFVIILTPYWSAITEAFAKDEFNWIKKNMLQLTKVAIVFSFGLIAMLILSDFAFKMWIGNKVIIPFNLRIAFTCYNIMLLFLSPYTYFLNGVGKLNLNLRVAIYKSIVFFPLAIYFVKQFGASGLVISLFFANILPNLIFDITQYKRIINKTATGIWNR